MVADRAVVIRRLHEIVEGQEEHFEIERRRKVADAIEMLRRERIESPQLLVEAPVRVLSHKLRNLPSGVSIAPGRITVEFTEPREALEKLLALAKAIDNDYDSFESASRHT
jgi:hypothetical protein